MQQVKVPFRFLEDVEYLLMRYKPIAINIGDYDGQYIIRKLESELQAKYDAINKRAAFAAYKTAVPSAERENARQEYLDAAGITESFRTTEELNL